ncbi:hypothetical protein B0H16DRAFT_1581388 [Mycena metata]|uniref:Uncharacterized protein n=1 Tax=Mycena metata TaxID=1033252 RepID=A0AAD7I0H9_9AGAR|nr:hypothetical protein B0H16DRAFT_1581388 [Mycena metata]
MPPPSAWNTRCYPTTLVLLERFNPTPVRELRVGIFVRLVVFVCMLLFSHTGATGEATGAQNRWLSIPLRARSPSRRGGYKKGKACWEAWRFGCSSNIPPWTRGTSFAHATNLVAIGPRSVGPSAFFSSFVGSAAVRARGVVSLEQNQHVYEAYEGRTPPDAVSLCGEFFMGDSVSGTYACSPGVTPIRTRNGKR